MENKIIISETSKETRVAILEDGVLVEFFVEKAERTRMVGNIYKGKIENVVKGIQAAFIDVGSKKNVFLPFSEIRERQNANIVMENILSNEKKQINKNRKKRNNDNDVNLKSGEDILVQVIKEPFADKGARVTTDISLPGRFLVLVPYTNYIGVSKRIHKKGEKRRLKKIAREIKPDSFGIIIRTVAESIDKEELQADLDSMMKKWHKMVKTIKNQKQAGCVYFDVGTAIFAIRDLLTSDVDKIIVDQKRLYKTLHSYLKIVSPRFVKKLEYYGSHVPIFDQYNVEKEFQKSLGKKIWLKSGGFIVIEHTEAMTTVDVNSGKYIGKKDHEKISVKTNLLAAREIARQLRLRDIGGLIVIDFIDMSFEENKKKIFFELKRELGHDKAKVALSPISEFGLLEMTRERIRLNLLYSVSEECPLCSGSGRITSKASLVTQIESWIRRFKTKSRERRLILFIHPDLAEYIRSSTKKFFMKMQWKYFMRIKITEEPGLNIDEFKVFSAKKNIEITDKY